MQQSLTFSYTKEIFLNAYSLGLYLQSSLCSVWFPCRHWKLEHREIYFNRGTSIIDCYLSKLVAQDFKVCPVALAQFELNPNIYLISGPEALAWAYWYQSMLMQSNPMSWLPSMMGSVPPQNSGIKNGDFPQNQVISSRLCPIHYNISSVNLLRQEQSPNSLCCIVCVLKVWVLSIDFLRDFFVCLDRYPLWQSFNLTSCFDMLIEWVSYIKCLGVWKECQVSVELVAMTLWYQMPKLCRSWQAVIKQSVEYFALIKGHNLKNWCKLLLPCRYSTLEICVDHNVSWARCKIQACKYMADFYEREN